MIQASGEQQLPASAEIVRERLRQMHWLVSQMPNLARVELVAEERARFVVRPGFSFLRGEMTVQLERLAEPDGLAWRMEVRGIGSSAKATVRCSIVKTSPDSCRLEYQVVIEELGGLLRTPTPFLIASCRRKNRAGFPCQFCSAVSLLPPTQAIRGAYVLESADPTDRPRLRQLSKRKQMFGALQDRRQRLSVGTGECQANRSVD
jgi:carbon monoxide dehydrogenase subunit G